MLVLTVRMEPYRLRVRSDGYVGCLHVSFSEYSSLTANRTSCLARVAHCESARTLAVLTPSGLLRDCRLRSGNDVAGFRRYDYGSYFRHRRSSRSPSPTAGMENSVIQSAGGMATPDPAIAIPASGVPAVTVMHTDDAIPLPNAYTADLDDLETLSVHSSARTSVNTGIPPLNYILLVI